ncbi:hypothetical protein BURC_00229 [Burkholderiaceae bacterium]|nr:hypothetical protein BURC_00229 [Burkholderiaceae bacterium]
MSRNKKRSPIDDFVQLVAMLPGWAGVALAIVAYVALHYVAARPVAASIQPGQVGAVLMQTVWKSSAGIGQYLLPLLCLIAAAVSAVGRGKRKGLVANVVRSSAADALDGITWREFEMLVGEAFRLQGYRVLETGGGGSDQGVDLVLARGNEKFLVQCKQWKAFKVGVDVVRELYGVMAAKGAAGGFVVTSGRFTDDATAFASGRNLKLVDGPVLLGLLRQAKESQAMTTSVPASSAGRQAAAASKTSGAGSAPACPVCASKMVKRTAKRRANAGNNFWGCSSYPACRGTLPSP